MNSKFLRLAFLFILLATAKAEAASATNTANVTWYWVDFMSGSQTNKRVTMTPLQPFLDYTNAMLSAAPRARLTGTNGSVTFSNVVSGYSYRVQFDIATASVVRTCGIPATVTGNINGRDYLGDVRGQSFYYLFPFDLSSVASNIFIAKTNGQGYGAILYDAGGKKAFDASQHQAFDAQATAKTSADFDARSLVKSDGATASLDWQNLILSGAWFANGANFTNLSALSGGAFATTNLNVIVVSGAGTAAVNQNYYFFQTNSHGVIWTNPVNTYRVVQSNADLVEFYAYVDTNGLWDIEDAAGANILYDNEGNGTPFARWGLGAAIIGTPGTAPPPIVTPLFTYSTNTTALQVYGPLTNATLWVDSTRGNDLTAKRGQQDLPFKSILKANQASQLGDTIRIEPGDYSLGGWPLTTTNLTIIAWGANVRTTNQQGGVLAPYGYLKVYGGYWTNGAMGIGGMTTINATNVYCFGATIAGSLDAVYGAGMSGPPELEFDSCKLFSYWDGIVLSTNNVPASARGKFRMRNTLIHCRQNADVNRIHNASNPQALHGLTLGGLDGDLQDSLIWLQDSATGTGVSISAGIIGQNASDYFRLCGVKFALASTNGTSKAINRIAGTIDGCPGQIMDLGLATLTAGTNLITSSLASRTNLTFVSPIVLDSTNFTAWVTNRVEGTNFVIMASTTTTNKVAWQIVKP